jgi:uncharacterized beta-barrel protein YwiB (DUF1934 family)
MNINKHVNLFTKAIQIDKSGDKSEIEFFVEGTYTEKSGFIYITYKESGLSGMEGTTTTLKIASNSLSIIRFGTYNSKLEFKQGERTLSKYQTPYGSIPITINTKLLDIALRQGEKSNIQLEYDLEAAGEDALMNEIIISFEKQDSSLYLG